MQQKLDLLERDIRSHCSPHHWYTHLMLIRLQEDRLLERTPALFQPFWTHLLRHLAPFAAADALLTWVMWRHGTSLVGAWAGLCLALLGVGSVLAQIDWQQITHTRTLLRLPARWNDYRDLRP